MGELERSIDRGCGFLTGMQDGEGLWHDAEFEGAGSDLVTAYVARCLWALLSRPGSEPLQGAYDRACEGLSQRQRPNGGWAYSSKTTTDAEATAWALICLLDQRDRRGFSTSRARSYLYAHHDPDSGGFCPYVTPVDAGEGFRAPQGLCEPQPCVTGAVVRALATAGTTGPVITAACEYLKRTQGEDGLWASALWAHKAAPTYLALSALDMAHMLDDSTRLAAREGIGSLLGSARGYELAAALVCAPRLEPRRGMDDAIERLIAEQDDEGAWNPPGRLRATSPVGAPNREDGSVQPDIPYRGRLLTTATAVTGLYFSGGAAEAYSAYSVFKERSASAAVRRPPS